MVNISVEESILKQKKTSLELKRKMDDTWKRQQEITRLKGNVPEASKLHKQWATMKRQERVMDIQLEKSEAFLRAKQTKQTPKLKKHISFSEHLFSKL